MKSAQLKFRSLPNATMLFLAISLLARGSASAVGSFAALSSSPSFTPGHMLLLSDGTVLVLASFGNACNRLIPDSHGHYINGSFTNQQSMHDTREYYSSAVLQDGRVFVAGGEFGTGAATAEIFNPQANGGYGSWTYITPPTSLLNPSAPSPALASGNQAFLDSECVILADGKVLVAPVGPRVWGGTLIYNPFSNTWSDGPTTVTGYSDETSWAKLPDDSILTIDPFGLLCERYLPSQNQWLPEGNASINLWSTNKEIGASVLLTNGTVIYFGGNGASAIYTPSPLGGTNFGSWAIGPNLPPGLVMRDCPSATLVNGKILLALVPRTGDSPISFYEYDPTSQSFTFAGSDNAQISDQTSMVELPDGTILFNDTSSLYVYTPDTPPLPAGKPDIHSFTFNSDGSLHFMGTLFNGLNQGAMYGDDAQQDSNYPLVKLTDGSGNVTFGHTYNWSRTSVMTGNAVVSTDCNFPPDLSPGTYSLQVIANGIASTPLAFDAPVWVDFNYTGIFQFGTYDLPYKTMASGTNAVPSGGTILINGNIQPSASAETMTISKPMTIRAANGPSTIGHS